MKKIVVKLNSLDDKPNPMQAVSSLSGIISMELNIKDSKITIVGDVDPILIVKKLRKWIPKIETLGDVKEEKKPEPEKKPPADKPKVPTEQEQIAMHIAAYRYHNAHYAQPYYVQPYDENANSCVIC